MGNLILGFDVETTGIPDWQKPSGHECQPHIVSLAAALFDDDTRQIVQSMNVIVRPEEWDIPQETIDLHGITVERAMDVGVSENTALYMFLDIWYGRTRIAYNTTFDNRIIRIATKRYSGKIMIDKWETGKQGEEWKCMMLKSKKLMGGKQPKLVDAYKHFTGEELKNAHTAWADMMACMEIYFQTK